MLKLWGRTSSINVQKVVWALEEFGVAYDRVDAGGAYGIVDTPDYRRLNPNGLVPTIEDDGFVLWESNAIVRYLAAKYPQGGLWPADLRLRADADRWMDWQIAMTTAMRDAFWQAVRTTPAQRDASLLQRSIAATEPFAAILDRHLAARQFLTGETFTIGDIAVGCAGHRWMNLPLHREARPNVERWLDRLYGRPAAQTVLVAPIT